MNNEPKPVEEAPFDDDLRPHCYDGIQEYDKRLPNWWLWTFYGAIIFSIGYWSLFHHWHISKEPGIAVTEEIKENALLAAKNSGTVTDEQMWAMSRDPATVGAGRTTFSTTCVPCHGDHLQGKIGPTLIKEVWLHGGRPTEIIHTITNGVPPKGMPTWGPILGRNRIIELAAFILSFRTPPKALPPAPVSKTAAIQIPLTSFVPST
jgi:cytochrome c oxidase cbb3-type subunit 3